MIYCQLQVNIRFKKMLKKFVLKFLKKDGVFLIRMIAENTSEMIAAELICALWTGFPKVLASKALGVSSPHIHLCQVKKYFL